MTFTFTPPAAAPTAVAAPAAAFSAGAALEPSIVVPAPNGDLEEYSLPRHENEFDEKNGQCYDCVKTVHKFDCPELVVRNVQLYYYNY